MLLGVAFSHPSGLTECRLWHLAISSPHGAYNISRINEEIIRKTRKKVYWDDRHIKDRERDYRVRPPSVVAHCPRH